jgi:AcrR family transcriptional regulator
MGSIYALFPGKEQLFASIIETRGNEILELAHAVVGSQPEPLQALEALATAYIDYFYDHRDFLRMHIRTGASWALEPHYPGARATLTRAFHNMQRDLFARGIEAGVFVDEDPSYLAALFTGIDQTVLAHWVANGMQGSRDELRERFLRVTRKVFVRTR